MVSHTTALPSTLERGYTYRHSRCASALAHHPPHDPQRTHNVASALCSRTTLEQALSHPHAMPTCNKQTYHMLQTRLSKSTQSHLPRSHHIIAPALRAFPRPSGLSTPERRSRFLGATLKQSGGRRRFAAALLQSRHSTLPPAALGLWSRARGLRRRIIGRRLRSKVATAILGCGFGRERLS